VTDVLIYEVRGPIAWLTMNRPEARNAQDTALIDAIDAALDRADADDDIRVVVLAGAGEHWSAGHDLKALLSDADEWARMRATAEGKWRHEEVMYAGRCERLYHFRKPTIAAVQGACVAAGMMLASMCDLIVAADDAFFANPVARMTGVGVELLVEPWELGFRKAKEFLLTGDRIDAHEAWRLGLVNRVVPRSELDAQTQTLAEQVAQVPPMTAEMTKRSINQAAALAGKEHSWRYHFALHQYASNTETALRANEERRANSRFVQGKSEPASGDPAPSGDGG
jgi:enoyl-CoA hydratase